MTLVKKLSLLFDIHAGEEKLVGLLLIHSFFIGMAQILLKTTSTTLFLINFDSTSIPYVYIGSAIAAPLTGYLFARLERRLSFRRLLVFNLILLVSGLVFFRFSLVLFPGARWNIFALYVWYYIQDVLINLEFWGLAGRLMDMRQGKRLFGLIGAGEMVARAISGFSVPWLVRLVGTPNLLVLSIAGVAACIVLLFSLAANPALDALPEGRRKSTDKTTRPASNRGGFSALLRSPYILWMIALAVLALIGYYFVDMMYVSETRAHFTSSEALASFLGSFEALNSVLALVSGLFLAGPIISRFGVSVSLMILPVFSGACVLLLALSGSVAGGTAMVFWLAAVSKMVFITFRKSTDKSASRILYQPLPTAQRLNAQTLIGSIIEPAASGVAGVALLLLPANTVLLAWVMVAVVGVWIVVVGFLGREYRTALVRALSQRTLGDVSIDLMDAASKEYIQKGLESPYAGEVIYFLDILEQSGDASIEPALRRLVSHPAPQVRQNVLARIERLNMTTVLKRVRDRIKLEANSQVQGAALRTLAALGETDVLDLILPYLSDSDPQVKRGAMVGLLRSGGIEGILAAGESLIELVNSTAPAQRRLAAAVLGEVGITNFYRPLLKLLADDDSQVRKEALLAAGRLKNPRLWPLVIENLSIPGLRSVAGVALLAGGDQALPALETTLVQPALPLEMRIRCARVCGKLGGSKAVGILLAALPSAEPVLRYSIYMALRESGYRAPTDERPAWIARLRDEVGRVAWTMTAITDCSATESSTPSGDQTGAGLLLAALDRKLSRHIEQIFLLLAFLYDPEPVMNAWNILYVNQARGEKRAYAVEAIDVLIAQELKPYLLPLLEDLTDEERLRRLGALCPQTNLVFEERLKDIIQGSGDGLSPWLRGCALYELGQHNRRAYRHSREDLVKSGAAGRCPDAWAVTDR